MLAFQPTGLRYYCGPEGFNTKAQGTVLQQLWDTAQRFKLLPEAPLLSQGAPGTHPENGGNHTVRVL